MAIKLEVIREAAIENWRHCSGVPSDVTAEHSNQFNRLSCGLMGLA